MSSFCVTTTANSVDNLRIILEELHLNDPTRRLKFLKDENLVAVPIKNINAQIILSADDLKEKIRSHRKFEKRSFHIRSLDLPASKKLSVKKPVQLLKTELERLVKRHGYAWTKDITKDIPNHWERHGDLVLVPGTAFTLPVWTDIGTDVWLTVTECLSCSRLARKCPVSVDHYRTPQVTMLHGSNTWVQHVDNGIRYTYDVTKCMFSAGNITEKLRVAGFKCDNEVIVDLYAGIGYFTLPYLMYTGAKHLHACEWNPDAVEALRRNLAINKVEDRCTVHEGDNKKVCPIGVADRVNLGLIPSSHEGWPVACAALKPSTGGILHIHYNVNTKPRTDQDKGSRCSEPQEVFRCEAKTQIPEDRGMSGSGDQNSQNVLNQRLINSGSQDVGNKHNCCENERTDRCNDMIDKGSDLTDTSIGVKETNTEIDPTCGSDRCKNQPCKSKTHVMNSKWYSWAVGTAEEIRDILVILHHNDWSTDILHIEHVKSYAPFVDHVVLDLKCKPCS